MAKIKILKRLKNNQGKTIAYEIQNVGMNDTQIMAVDNLRSLSNYVVNAKLLSNGEFRASYGHKIETEVDMGYLKNKRLPIKVDKNILNNTQTSSIDYYGKPFIKVCKQIRQLAQSNNIILDKALTSHISNAGNNIHLIKIIEACGIDVKDFMKSYLEVIQPYYFEDGKNKKDIDKNDIWILDVGYRIKLFIKIKKISERTAILVSFHESNIIRTYNKKDTRITQSSGMKDFSDKLCAVIVDKVEEYRKDNKNKIYNVKYTVQRGFIREELSSLTPFYSNGAALVEYKDIKNTYQSIMDNVIDNLRETYYDSVTSKSISLDINRISLLSYGYTPINNICLLLDYFSTHTDRITRSVVIEITNNILYEMPISSITELRLALEDKYGRIVNYDNALYDRIIAICQSEENINET